MRKLINKDFEKKISLDQKKILSLDEIKTTDINVLLNRVRLEKKKSIKKKLSFLILISAIISFIIVYFNN